MVFVVLCISLTVVYLLTMEQEEWNWIRQI